ncbi:hypothetical protein LSAT2_011899 [Lamellibrachia satsuma]|nr:hypothetical protein LSAT2_011899 [Lamellibrachia satsuma]
MQVVHEDTAINQAPLKVTKICLVVLLLFTILATPFEINQVYGAFDYGASLPLMGPLFVLASISSCVHPIVLGVGWKPFQVMVLRVMPFSQAILSATPRPHTGLFVVKVNAATTRSRIHVRSNSKM